VGTLVHRVQELEAGHDATGSRATTALQLVEDLDQPFEKLLVYVWRRHLAAAVGRIETLGANEEDLHTTQVTVGFADISPSRRCPTSWTTTASAIWSRPSSRAAPTS
jgi:adenylate cyclase